MEVTITQFRKDLFALVREAQKGTEVWVKHKGGRFRIEPETKPKSKMDRLTRCDFINHEISQDDGALLREMTEAWEKDWEELDRLP